jgi:hypothetical protein
MHHHGTMMVYILSNDEGAWLHTESIEDPKQEFQKFVWFEFHKKELISGGLTSARTAY